MAGPARRCGTGTGIVGACSNRRRIHTLQYRQYGAGRKAVLCPGGVDHIKDCRRHGDILVSSEDAAPLRAPLERQHAASGVEQVTRVTADGVYTPLADGEKGPEAVGHAVAFAPVCDYLILDSYAPHIGGVGATGATHDWSRSRQIVEAVDIRVILAGGLSPDNVAEAIAAVQPWAVDSLTHTNKDLGDGRFCKDLAKVDAFVKAAQVG